MKNINQNPDAIKKMNKLTRFFCWAGGGNIDVLNEMPTERNRFFSYGTVICMTALFAFLSSSYAFILLLKKGPIYVVILPAIAWALFIFFLDRFFIVSVSNRGTFLSKLGMAWPRLLLAAFIGIIISKPLEYRIFEQEIQDELRQTKLKLLADLDTLRSQIKAEAGRERNNTIDQLAETIQLTQLQEDRTIKSREIAVEDSTLNARGDSATGEDKGWGKSKLRGQGDNYNLHKTIMDSATAKKSRLEDAALGIETAITAIDAVRRRIIKDSVDVIYHTALTKADEAYALQRTELTTNYAPSILNQEIALGALGSREPTAWWSTLFVTLLFVFIEMAPMILKLMTKAGAYENRISQIESTYSTEDRLRRSLDMEEYKSNRGLVRHLARSQREIIKTAMNSWHDDQMNKMQENPEYYNNMFNGNHDN